MGRRKIEVNETVLRDTIKLVESGGALPNLSALFNEVAEKMGLKPHIVRCRIEELSIPTLSIKGERGRKKGEGPCNNTTIPRKAKLSEKSKKILLNTTPKKFHKLIFRAEKSSKALVALKCLDCTCHQISEIRKCTSLDCPLWSIRPYRERLLTSDNIPNIS